MFYIKKAKLYLKEYIYYFGLYYTSPFQIDGIAFKTINGAKKYIDCNGINKNWKITKEENE